MSMYDRDPLDETWFVHAPVSRSKKDFSLAPPPSNIPYLNGIFNDEATKPNEIWFKETDSDFIKLSKLGGRDDLLIHNLGKVKKEPQPYPRAQWWNDMLVDENAPRKEEKKHIFQIPAWFAHNDSLKEVQVAKKAETSIPRSRLDIDFGIQEPPKYGQLRNYLNPVRYPSKNPLTTPYRTRVERDESHTQVKSPQKEPLSRQISKQSFSKRPFK